MGFLSDLLGVSNSDAEERTLAERDEIGREDLGRTAPDSENMDPGHSCGGGEGTYDH